MNPTFPWLDDITSISERLGPGLSAQLASYPLPPVHQVRQRFPNPVVEDIEAAVRDQFAREEVRARLQPGSRVCIAVGSRGIAHILRIVKAVVREVKAAGGEPFVIPAMGSHGGATSQGQLQVLADYGITPESIGAPVVSNIDVAQVGATPDGTPVYCSTDASSADHIILVARVKPHTGFRGPVESGLMKMMVIGLGKQRGADTMHDQGMDRFNELIPAAGKVILQTQPIAFGLAIVENGYDEPARIEAVLPEGLHEREIELLAEARSLMPSLPFEKIDVVVIQAIGKNISGSGLDPNVVGRFVRSNGPAYTDRPFVQKVAVLDLTQETHGNAAGVGLCEIISMRVLQKIDFKSTYANCITASHVEGAMLPVVMENDRMAIACAAKTAVRTTPETLKLVIIRTTLDVGEIWISPALLEEARAQPHLEVSPNARPLEFDADGALVSPIACVEK